MSDAFVPTMVSDRCGIMVIGVRECAICHKPMVKKPSDGWSPFPTYGDCDLGAQLERAGWVEESAVSVDGDHICKVCEDAGKADFLCALCGERKPTDKVKEVFGDTPFEFLCTDCFGSVSAKVWAEKLRALYDAHKFDFS